MWMKGDRLHIHLVHLEEVKPTEMPVEAHWRTQDYSQVQLWDTHFHLNSQSLALFLYFSLFLFLSLHFRHSVSPPSAQCVLSKALISLVLARFCMYSLCLLSPIYLAYQSAFMCQSFFFFPLVCCRRAFIFPRLLIIKSFIGRSCSEASEVTLLTEGHNRSHIYIMIASEHSVFSNKAQIFNSCLQSNKKKKTWNNTGLQG